LRYAQRDAYARQLEALGQRAMKRLQLGERL
jgi:hypothetical protein